MAEKKAAKKKPAKKEPKLTTTKVKDFDEHTTVDGSLVGVAPGGTIECDEDGLVVTYTNPAGRATTWKAGGVPKLDVTDKGLYVVDTYTEVRMPGVVVGLLPDQELSYTPGKPHEVRPRSNKKAVEIIIPTE